MEQQDIDIKALLEIAISAGKATLDYYNSSVEVQIKKDDSPLTQADLESNKIINAYLETTGTPILSEENKISDYSERKLWSALWVVDPLDGTKEFINGRTEFTINIALVINNEPVFGVIYAPVLDELFYGIKGEGAFRILKASKHESMEILLAEKEKLPVKKNIEELIVVASKSHLNDDTRLLINQLETKNEKISTKSYGSSLKLCRLAEGEAHIYPRMGPTMEWDTAAGHAIASAAGCVIVQYPEKTPLIYNKENTLNPYFIAYHADVEPYLP